MAKGMKTITLDTEVIDLIKIRGIELSPLVNDFLKHYLKISHKKDSEIDILIRELKETEKKLESLKVMISQKEREEEKKKENFKEVDLDREVYKRWD